MSETLQAELPLYAPIAGWLVPLADVADQVFAGQIIGNGFAVDPTENLLHAPFDGVVSTLHEARHAITIKAACGAELLMHIGLDTVRLGGAGFTALVACHDRVRAGDPLISFDMDAVARQARSLIVPVVLTGGGALSEIPAPYRLIPQGAELCRIHPLIPAAPNGQNCTQDSAHSTLARTVRVTEPVGMHARPAGRIAEIAKSVSGTDVLIRLGEKAASAASPVGLMLLGARCGDELRLEATGPDAARLLAEISAIISSPMPAAPSCTPRQRLTGRPGAPGIAAGTSVQLTRHAYRVPPDGADPAAEGAALCRALDICTNDIRDEVAASDGHHSEILLAHLALMADESLRQTAFDEIDQGRSAACGWQRAINRQRKAIRTQNNPALQERDSDLEDICVRVLNQLLGKQPLTLNCPDGAILFAEDILPSQFPAYVTDKVRGIVLAGSGPTAHIAILAAARGIPAVVGAGDAALLVADAQRVILDGNHGTIEINPSEEDFSAANKTAPAARRHNPAVTETPPCTTADCTRIHVEANLSGPDDVPAALQCGAEGCGLFRSEYLFLGRSVLPDTEAQRTSYQQMADRLNGRDLIIRTLDIGADKNVPCIPLPQERNPALGLRGVRLRRLQGDILRNQIRAILQITPFGQTKILLPMITTMADLHAMKAIIAEEMQALGRTTPIATGIMIEVPAAALIARQIAAAADFISIGTNDLAQYTLAMDRTSGHLGTELDAFHPSVLRLIGFAAEAGAEHHKQVGVCGSLAAQPAALPLLIGLGVREISVPVTSLAASRKQIGTLDLASCRAIAQMALAQDSADAVRRLVHSKWPNL